VTPTEAAAIAVVDRAISVLSVIALGFLAYLLSPKTKGGSGGNGRTVAAEERATTGAVEEPEASSTSSPG
jgi:hypothetical protein